MTAHPDGDKPSGFHHEALLYAGEEEFLGGTLPFVAAGLEAGEAILVAVGKEKIGLLEEELGPEAELVGFTDMAELGRNPARIIPAWQEFLAGPTGEARRVRGIGEPTWPGRSADELIECQHHESLLNLAFEGGPPWPLLCPYDVARLAPEVVEGARRTHPHVIEGGVSHASEAYLAPREGQGPFEGPLEAAPAGAAAVGFSDSAELSSIREVVTRCGEQAGLGFERTMDLVLVANELATNSLRHGGGSGELRIWAENGSVVCEVRDRGRIEHPLVGRERPTLEQEGGRGVWLANQLSDLVQIRALPEGNVVRAHLRLDG